VADIIVTQDRSWSDIEKIPYINEHIKRVQSWDTLTEDILTISKPDIILYLFCHMTKLWYWYSQHKLGYVSPSPYKLTLLIKSVILCWLQC